ncbi:MAG: Xylose isomerase-like barrel [Gemmataceae bacterium]|nr:Xylose isomerase-like barrel [Gemmataceae bacterium]
MQVRHFALLVVLLLLAPALPADPPASGAVPAVFARDNLVAWCIVPFDKKNRTPAERVEMLGKLGFKRYAYDWRAQHLPTFDAEVALLRKHGIELTAVWFPANLGADAQTLLGAIKKHGVKPQLWVSMGDPGGKEQAEKVEAAARVIRPIAEEADKLGCAVGLYNHGNWFGEPENQLAVIDHLKLKNVGIVYNLHHGHNHLDRFPALLKKMKPHLLALNLNGMVKDGEKAGKKILPLGQGDLDLPLLKTIAESGYKGPIGILGHTQDDAQERLQDNLDGLDWLLPQLAGKPAGPKPKPRTMTAAAPAAPGGGWLAGGKPEYRAPPLTVECRAKFTAKDNFNILVASDTKTSGTHWELFTWPKTGHLTVYMTGMKPDHVRSRADICDERWHTIAMQYEPGRIRLFVDGKKVADEAVTSENKAVVPGGIAFAQLVEGGLGCAGDLDRVRISKGIITPTEKELAPDDATLGFWTFTGRDKPAPDGSKLKNPAAPTPTATPVSAAPPPGPNLTPTDPALKVTLIDRSPDDAYMAVKVDGTGHVFVGGREKVFVFAPDGRGGFRPRIELLRFPQDSIIIGLEFRGDDLYVLASHGLYLVPGGRVKRDGLAPKRILWGVPLDYHVSFHCLAWGPEGDLYLDHGDPLLNYGDWSRPDHWGYWTLYAGPDGAKTPYTGAGAVLKVRPDGSAPRVVARGLRGPVGLAFDRHWNLFTNDNDHESRPDQYAPARLLHVTPQADFGWPRGWMASKSPDRADLLDSVHPALGRGVPCDLAYYDEPALPALRGNLLMCRWDRFAVTRYPLRLNGASFAADEHVFTQGSNQCRPTGVTVDAAGRVFITAHYLGGNVVTPHCPSDLVMIAPADGPAVKPFDETRASVDELWTALGGPSGVVRSRAHQELIRRGGKALDGAWERLRAVRDDDPAAPHLPWLAAAGKMNDVVAERAADRTRPVTRLQAIRALAAYAADDPSSRIFDRVLVDPVPAVQLAGLDGLLTGDCPLPVEEVSKLAGSSDPVVRQTAAILLARRGTTAQLSGLIRTSDPRIRLGAVLAAGIKLTVPPADSAPPQKVTLHFPKGNAFFSPVLRFADTPTPVDLTTLGPIGSYTTAQRWAVGTRTQDENRLYQLLLTALDDPDDLVRSQAAYYLGWLRAREAEPRVDRVRLEARTRGLKDRPPVMVKDVWRIGRISLAATEQAIEHGPIDLTAAVTGGKPAWEATSAPDGKVPLPRGEGSAYVYFRVQSRDRQLAILSIGSAEARVWHNGRSVPPGSDGSALLDLQPGSNDVLLRTTSAHPLVLSVRARGGVSASLPEKADGALLAERLKNAKGAAAIPPEFLKIDWTMEGRKGDAERGRKLFGSLGCAKCHAVTADQAGGGAPSLTEAGKRFTPAHLAESVLLPDRLVAEEFRGTRVAMADGRVLTGLVVRESATEIELLLPDTTRTVLKVAEIEERKPVATSPMPVGLVRTPAELQDLLTYLLSDHPLPP